MAVQQAKTPRLTVLLIHRTLSTGFTDLRANSADHQKVDCTCFDRTCFLQSSITSSITADHAAGSEHGDKKHQPG